MLVVEAGVQPVAGEQIVPAVAERLDAWPEPTADRRDDLGHDVGLARVGEHPFTVRGEAFVVGVHVAVDQGRGARDALGRNDHGG